MDEGRFAPGGAPEEVALDDEVGGPRLCRTEEGAARSSTTWGAGGALEKREARRALREAVQAFARDPAGANALRVERAIAVLRRQRRSSACAGW